MKILDLFKEAGPNKHEMQYPYPDLTAFYWDGSTAEGRRLKNVSTAGAYFLTRDRWYPGTILEVTLRHNFESANNGRYAAHFTLPCKVMRSGPDGFGVRFVTNGRKKLLERFINDAISRSSNAATGAALVEFALLIPLLFVLTIIAVNFGSWIYCWMGVANAARAAADYATLSSASAYNPLQASGAAILQVAQSDLQNLPNFSSSNPAISVCENNNGTSNTLGGTSNATCSNTQAGTCSATSSPQDPEIESGNTTYSDISVNITYTYTPVVSSFNFPSLGVSVPGMATTIHKCVVMRVLQ